MCWRFLARREAAEETVTEVVIDPDIARLQEVVHSLEHNELGNGHFRPVPAPPNGAVINSAGMID
jgi:hypothetical protein